MRVRSATSRRWRQRSGTVGLGNIAGVAVAVGIGGPVRPSG
ncbi:MAG: alanine:cation symporter family protein [Geminicoccaceae bacterium]